MTAPFPPVPGVSRDPLPTMTRRTRWERFLDRVIPMEPERLYRPSRLDQKDGIR